jgi:hypothetical protein
LTGTTALASSRTGPTALTTIGIGNTVHASRSPQYLIRYRGAQGINRHDDAAANKRE